MLLWGDRLLDSDRFRYGTWEASKTGSHGAVDRIPKDIIVCDWHYGRRADYPSIRFFLQQGFRVLPAPWKRPACACTCSQLWTRSNMSAAAGVFQLPSPCSEVC